VFTRTTLQTIQDFPKPTVAMVSGYCIGAGVAIAAVCDLRIAAADARLGIPSAKLGIGYPYANTKRLTDLVGPAQAKRILFSGDRFDVIDMHRIGLVDEVVPAQELESHVRALATRIAANAPLSVGAGQACGGGGVRRKRADSTIHAFEAREQACIDSEDHAEGRRAFMQKRSPIFRGPLSPPSRIPSDAPIMPGALEGLRIVDLTQQTGWPVLRDESRRSRRGRDQGRAARR